MDVIVLEFREQLKLDPSVKVPSAHKIVEQAKQWILGAYAAVTVQLAAMDEAQKTHVDAGMERYDKEYQQMVNKDGDHVASPHGLYAHAKALDYVDEWLSGCFLIYLCRRRDCLHFARNIHWVTTDAKAVTAITQGAIARDGGYQFRCAHCGEQFNQFKPKDGTLIGATHIITFNAPSGQARMMLLSAPSDSETGLINSMKEATLKVPEEVQNMSRDEQLKELFGLMRTRSLPIFFKHQVFSEKVKAHIDGINEKGKRVWYYDHLLNGYEGNTLKDPSVKQHFAFDFDAVGAEDAVVVTPIVMRKFLALLTSQHRVVQDLQAMRVSPCK